MAPDSQNALAVEVKDDLDGQSSTVCTLASRDAGCVAWR